MATRTLAQAQAEAAAAKAALAAQIKAEEAARAKYTAPIVKSNFKLPDPNTTMTQLMTAKLGATPTTQLSDPATGTNYYLYPTGTGTAQWYGVPKGSALATPVSNPTTNPTMTGNGMTLTTLQKNTQNFLAANPTAAQKEVQANITAANQTAQAAKDEAARVAAEKAAAEKAAATKPAPTPAPAAPVAPSAQITQLNTDFAKQLGSGTLTQKQIDDYQSKIKTLGGSAASDKLIAQAQQQVTAKLSQSFKNELNTALNSGKVTTEQIADIAARAKAAGYPLDTTTVNNANVVAKKVADDAAYYKAQQEATAKAAADKAMAAKAAPLEAELSKTTTLAQYNAVLDKAKTAGVTLNPGVVDVYKNKITALETQAKQAAQNKLNSTWEQKVGTARTQADFDKIVSDAKAAGAEINQGILDRTKYYIQQAETQAKQSVQTKLNDTWTQKLSTATTQADYDKIVADAKTAGAQLSQYSLDTYKTRAQQFEAKAAADKLLSDTAAKNTADFEKSLPDPQAYINAGYKDPTGKQIYYGPDNRTQYKIQPGNQATGEPARWVKINADTMAVTDVSSGKTVNIQDYNKQVKDIEAANSQFAEQQRAQEIAAQQAKAETQKALAASTLAKNTADFEKALPSIADFYKSGKTVLRGPDGSEYYPSIKDYNTGEQSWIKQTEKDGKLSMTNLKTGQTQSAGDFYKNEKATQSTNNQYFANQRAQQIADQNKSDGFLDFLGKALGIVAVVAIGGAIVQAISAAGGAAAAAADAGSAAATAGSMAEAGASAAEIASALEAAGLPSAAATAAAETATGIAAGTIDAVTAAAVSGIDPALIAAANATLDPIAALNATAGWTAADTAYLASIGASPAMIAAAEANNVALGLPANGSIAAPTEVAGATQPVAPTEVAAPTAPAAPGAPPPGSVPVAGPNGEQLFYDGQNFYNANGTINTTATAGPGQIVAQAGDGVQVAGNITKDGTVWVDSAGYAYPRDPITGTVNLGGEPIGQLTEAQMEAAIKGGELIPGGDFGPVVPGAESVGAGGTTAGGTAITGAETGAGAAGTAGAGAGETAALGTGGGATGTVGGATGATGATGGALGEVAGAAGGAAGGAAAGDAVSILAASGLTDAQIAALGGVAAAAGAVATLGAGGAVTAANQVIAGGTAATGGATGGATGTTTPTAPTAPGPTTPTAPTAPTAPGPTTPTAPTEPTAPGTTTPTAPTAPGTTTPTAPTAPTEPTAPGPTTPTAPTAPTQPTAPGTTTPTAPTTPEITAPTAPTTPGDVAIGGGIVAGGGAVGGGGTTPTAPGPTTPTAPGPTTPTAPVEPGTGTTPTTPGPTTPGPTTPGPTTPGPTTPGPTTPGPTTPGPTTPGTPTTPPTTPPLTPITPVPITPTPPPPPPVEVIPPTPTPPPVEVPPAPTPPETPPGDTGISPWWLAPLIPLILPKPVFPTPPGYGPLPPTEWGKVGAVKPTGLNPGFITDVPAQYQTQNMQQSKFYWGDRPYQPGPTFNRELYTQVPAPARPWGLQEMYTPTDINRWVAAQQARNVAAAAPAPVPGPIVPTKA